MEPVRMTRAEYEAKFGSKPSIPATPVTPSTSAAPATTAAPVKMTRAQYESTYGSKPIVPSAPTAAPKEAGFFGDSIPGKVGNFLTQGTQRFGKTIGEALNAPRAASMFAETSAQQSELENQTRQRIAEDKRLGKDTTRLERSLAQLTGSAPKIEDFTGDVINKTGGQIAGEAVGTALEASSGGLLGSGAKTAVSKTLSTGQKIKEGAKLGGLYGGIGGGAQAAAEGGGAGQIFTGAVGGGIAGAATGGVLEGVGSKLAGARAFQSPAVKENMDFSKNLNNAEKAIYGKLTPTEKAKVNLKDQSTLFGTKSVPDLQNTPGTKNIIEEVANLPDDIKIKPRDSVAVKNSKIQQGISRLHQETEGNLALPEMKRATTYDPQKFDDYMAEKVLAPIEREFGRESKEYLVAEKGIDVARRSVSEPNAYGVHKGRQKFDDIFEAENPRAFKQKNTLFGQLDPNVANTIETGRTIRDSLNDFAEELLPPDHPFRANLRRESTLIRALNEMRKRSTGDIDKNAVQRYLKEHPNQKKTLSAIFDVAKIGTGMRFLD